MDIQEILSSSSDDSSDLFDQNDEKLSNYSNSKLNDLLLEVESTPGQS